MVIKLTFFDYDQIMHKAFKQVDIIYNNILQYFVIKPVYTTKQ